MTILWVVIAITAVVLIIGGFAIWKFYTTCRNKSKIKTTKVKSINDNNGDGKKSSSSKSKLKANAGPQSGVISKKKSKKKHNEP